uniref:tRNA pseudouridine(55) synthase n=1 Tax=Fagus sylvatica TaxID=28930 RepID=A0A2N9FLI3_FAGSY
MANANNTEAAQQLSIEPEAAHVISATVERHDSTGDDDMQALHDVVQGLPSHVAKDLLSVGFTYCDDKKIHVKKESANDMAVAVSELVKREGYQIDSFSLEVSIPPIILENEHSVWLYMKRKYGSEPWFEGKSLSQSISAKDALKFSLAKPLETLLGAKWVLNPQTHPLPYFYKLLHLRVLWWGLIVRVVQWSVSCGDRSTKSIYGGVGTGNSVDSVLGDIKCSDFSDVTVERSFDGLQDNESSECFKFPLEKVNEACHLVLLCSSTPIYFGGRYLKYSRNVSQTRWIIDDERMGEASVEEIIGSNILPLCQGDNYKFHAAGREDIDVRMLGSGRPFLVEVQNARRLPSEAFVKEIETNINNLENKLVGVKNLKVVGSQGWAMMREGEAEKQKQYAALVWISRPLEDEDLDSISSFKDMQILQRTPIRVLHRRSPLQREKIIHWMKIERIGGSSQYFLLHLCTQAGTYIKEFVHGDLGRTHPSIGSILGCRAEILQLDVTDVKMDCFLTG